MNDDGTHGTVRPVCGAPVPARLLARARARAEMENAMGAARIEGQLPGTEATVATVGIDACHSALMQIEVVSVVSSAVVAVAGIVVPSVVKLGDREHERRMLYEGNRAGSQATWWERRELVYLDALKVAGRLRNVVERMERNKRATTLFDSEVTDLSARMDAYGSQVAARQMRELVGPLVGFLDPHLDGGSQDRRPSDILAEMKPRYAALVDTIRDELVAGPPQV
jgi:hypothetical protein